VIRLTLIAAARASASSVPRFPDASEQDGPRAWAAGAWAGRPIDDVARENPDEVRRWRADPSYAPPGGESLDALLARVGAWLDSLPDGRLEVRADATVIAAAVVHALVATAESFWHVDVPPSSATRLNRTAGTWRVRSLGLTDDVPH
jgi:broad specificity phosphatase PhoE